MRIYNGFMLFIATIVFIALGVCLISLGIKPEQTAESLFSFLRVNIGVLSIVGIVLFLMAIAEILLWFNSLNKMPVVAFNNPLGEVRVAYDALEGYIKSLSGEIHEIRDIKPQIVAGREGLEIHASLIVERDVNLPELTARFQDLVSRYVKDVMGIENISTIKVYIQKIASKKSRVLEEEKPPEEPQE